jgi:uncharacterized protein (TIGR04168 family)
MASAYGIHSMDESSRRLCALIDAAPSRDLVFLGHNGPAGLGARPTDMWGCDFKPGGGDWGDPDLAFALEHASQTGKRILAVIGGHMHLRTRTGGLRPWRCRKDGVLFLNISRVPRIFSANGRTERHHVALTIGPDGASARERYIDAV